MNLAPEVLSLEFMGRWMSDKVSIISRIFTILEEFFNKVFFTDRDAGEHGLVLRSDRKQVFVEERFRPVPHQSRSVQGEAGHDRAPVRF